MTCYSQKLLLTSTTAELFSTRSIYRFSLLYTHRVSIIHKTHSRFAGVHGTTTEDDTENDDRMKYVRVIYDNYKTVVKRLDKQERTFHSLRSVESTWWKVTVLFNEEICF